MNNVIDRVNTTLILAQMPGENMSPQAPEAFRSKMDMGLNLAFYIGILVAIIGVIVAGSTMVLSRREGSSEEATAMALRIGFGAMIIGSASAIIGAFL
ncbi:hypothetical protein [Corynebacterium aquilae]|uniref:Uncharacterized protein n=1 Tax=Corynebacterium aquilae DSM 44791 TaxID=1431546 RepID=A0A1L7CEH0_9CORY|nr:hypothetical protein [Corynebacterium aquilae]APT84227.1 hypothetical protein CAQU_03125 [Corynebacterium aquilae DSM 44791]